MMEFLILFLPTFISLYVLKNRMEISFKEVLIMYPLYNIIINGIVMFIVCIFKRGQIIYINENFNIMNFCIKYLLLSIIISLIIPYCIEFIKKNINIKIEIRRDKKKNEKSN